MDWGAALGGLDDQLAKIMARNQLAQNNQLDIIKTVQDVRNQNRSADRLEAAQKAQENYWNDLVGVRGKEAEARIQALTDKNATLEEKQAAVDAWVAMPEGPDKEAAGNALLKYGIKVSQPTKMVDILDRSGHPTGQKVPSGSMWTPAPPQTNVNVPILAIDPATGTVTQIGSAPKGAKTVNVPRESQGAQNAGADITQAKAIIKDLDTQSAALMTSNNWIGKMASGAKQATGSMLNMDDAARQYEVTRDGFLATISRLSGERGVLTDQDVARARLLLPAFGDSKALRDSKISKLMALLDQKEAYWKAKQSALTIAAPGGAKKKPAAAAGAAPAPLDPDALLEQYGVPRP